MATRITYHKRHLQRLDSLIDRALMEHPRCFVVRADLRMDEYIPHSGSNLMSRFVNSLKSQLKARERQRQKVKRVKFNNMRYIWCLEWNTSETKPHYHIALFFNKDEYFNLGEYDRVGSLAYMINKAWNSALGYRNDDTQGLVHFPKNGQYWIHVNGNDGEYERELVYKRLKYLCKNETKIISPARRSFGCSCQ